MRHRNDPHNIIPRHHYASLLNNGKNHSWNEKIPLPNPPDLPHSLPKPSLGESRLLVQFCAIPEQSPASCFERKQTAPNPEPYFPELHQHWQKPMSQQKNPLPKPPIPHKKAQFCTICTIFAQFCSNASGLLQFKANRLKPRKTFFPKIVQKCKNKLCTQKSLPNPA